MIENKRKEKIELLAPAGNMDAFIAAINAGADAVYMGLDKFNARNMAQNFTIDEYIYAIDYAHKRDVKVYLTLNILLTDSEIKDALNTLSLLYKEGLDAVILQDIGLASVIKKTMPDIKLHASTQMSVCSLLQVKFLEGFGFSRVVLARELTISEIKEIANNTNMEIEVFVHGALCVSVSGQCMMSSMIGDRSANRGTCAQPCRKTYSLYSNKSNIPIVSNKYILSKKDIYGIDLLKKLKDANVVSFKIEGRNKSPMYVASVVSKYRNTIDNNYVVQDGTEKELMQSFNRSGKSYGYLKRVEYADSISYNTPKNTGLVLGKVVDTKGVYIKVKLEENINMHDGIEILMGDKCISQIVTCIRDETFNVINKTSAKGNIVWLGDIKENVKIGSSVNKTSDSILNTSLEDYYNNKKYVKRNSYNVYVYIHNGEKIKAVVNDIETVLEYVPEESIKAPLSVEKVIDTFSKTEDTSVIFENIHVDISDNIFVPTSKLNELRRNIVECVESSKCIKRDVKNIDNTILKELDIKNKNSLSAKSKFKNTNGLFVYKYNKDTDYIKMFKEKYDKNLDKLYIRATDFNMFEEDIKKYYKKTKIYFVIPSVTLKNLEEYITQNIERLTKNILYGIVIGNVGFINMCKSLKEKYLVELIGDYSLNVMNKYSAKVYADNMIDTVTPIFEEENIDYATISEITNIELVEGILSAMTSRYCPISSFVTNSIQDKDCKCICKKENFYLVDSFDKKYDIVTDPKDCIVTFVRNKRKYDDMLKNKYSIRYNILY